MVKKMEAKGVLDIITVKMEINNAILKAAEVRMQKEWWRLKKSTHLMHMLVDKEPKNLNILSKKWKVATIEEEIAQKT